MDSFSVDGIFIDLFISVALYAAFPMIFAMSSKKEIAKKKYRRLCFLINFIVWLVVIVFETVTIGTYSTSYAYPIWTAVFSKTGAKQLEKRGLLIDSDTQQAPQANIVSSDSSDFPRSIDATQFAHEVSVDTGASKFCRFCGKPISSNIVFCPFCGKRL